MQISTVVLLSKERDLYFWGRMVRGKWYPKAHHWHFSAPGCWLVPRAQSKGAARTRKVLVKITLKLAVDDKICHFAVDTASPYLDHLAAGTVAKYKLAYRGIRESDVGAQSIAETMTVDG